MSKIYDVIARLTTMAEKHGNCELNIYNSFERKTVVIDVDEIYYDNGVNDIYIGIYG